MLPRRKASRATKQSVSATAVQDASNDSSTVPADVLYVQDCAARLQAVAGMGPKAVEALLAFAASPVSAALVEGLLGQIQLTSQQGNAVTSVVGGGGYKPGGGALPTVAAPVVNTVNRQSASRDESADMQGVLTGLSAPLPLADRMIVFTGTLVSGMSRAAAQALCEELGEHQQHSKYFHCGSPATNAVPGLLPCISSQVGKRGLP